MQMDKKNYEWFLSHVTGAIAIDMEGTVIYLNSQCADYIEVDKDWAMGKPISVVFPQTKMLEGLHIEKPTIVFYHSFGIGISIQVPLFDEGKRVGLMEYDVVQGSEFLYEFAENYTLFLDAELNTLRQEISELRNTKYSIDQIIGSSKVINELKENIRKAAQSMSAVVIFGETGTGKELVAHSIHSLSRRKKAPFVKLNAAGIPENLVESELFGYEGGSFTGALKEGKKGKFELANKGTLYLDEINQMPMTVQPKLLRVLQENEIERIGGTESIPVDVRIIVTSNEDLRSLVDKNKFRGDLFYRLHVIPIVIPPLRERKEDIPELVNYYVKIYAHATGKYINAIDERIYDSFMQYNWPGNVRELQNVLERAIIFMMGSKLLLEHVSAGFVMPASDPILKLDTANPIETAKQLAEKELIRGTLALCNNNKTQAAKLLKIPRPLLYQKIKRLGITEEKV
jgi:transcriptional regulator with PAS, ATPase and Fis domain